MSKMGKKLDPQLQFERQIPSFAPSKGDANNLGEGAQF